MRWPWCVVALLGLIACNDEVVVPPEGAGGAGGSLSVGSSMGSGSTPNALLGAQLGDVQLSSAQRIAFGPGGVLLIGDGRSDRLIAVETGDTGTDKRADNTFDDVENLLGQAAEAIGNNVLSSELQIEDVAVNPESWRTYVAVTRFTTLEAFVMTVGPGGKLFVFDLHNVVHAIVNEGPTEGGSALITDLAWTDDHVISAVTPQSFVGSELAFVGTPFAHEGPVSYSTARVYLRSWGQWVVDLPLERFVPHEVNGELFVVGGVLSAVARFRSIDLAPGAANVTGTTVFDLLDGRSIVDFLPYQRGKQSYVLASVQNLLFDGTAGAVRFDGKLFAETTEVNEAAPFVLDYMGNPMVPGVTRVYAADLARKLEPRGEDHAVVLRANALTTVELP